jgi:anti-sigma B factor antagonist
MVWKAMTPRVHGDIVVIDLDGKVGLGDEDALFSYVVTLLEQGFVKFVLNFVRVPYIDSMTLGETIRAYTTVARRGGRLALLQLHLRVRAVLNKEGLSGVIDMFDSEADALASFGDARPASGPVVQPHIWRSPRAGA